MSSTIPRKRIDVLLEMFGRFRRMQPRRQARARRWSVDARAAAARRAAERDRRARAASVSRAAATRRAVPARVGRRAAVRSRRIWIARRRSDGLRHTRDCERHPSAARSGRHRRAVLLRPATSAAGPTRSRSSSASRRDPAARERRRCRVPQRAPRSSTGGGTPRRWPRSTCSRSRGSAHRESASPRKVLSAGEGRHGDDPRAHLRAHRAARAESRARRNSRPSTVEERHGSIEVLRVAALMPASAPSPSARGCRSILRAKTPTSSCCTSRIRWPSSRIFLRAQGPAHRLVSQRRDSPELALPAVLSPVPSLRALPCRAHRRLVADARCIRPGAAGLSGEVQGHPIRRRSAGVLPIWKRPSQRAGEIRREANQPIVLFVGRLVPYKGVDVLLEALKGLDAVALIVGEGPLRARLEEQARELGVCRVSVRFLGAVDDDELAALYRACNIFVLPSVTRQEAFGVVQLEAMAAGKPVVSTDLGTGVGMGESSTARRVTSFRRATPARCARPSRGCSAIAALQKSMGEAAAKRIRSALYARADDRRHARAVSRRHRNRRPWQNGCLT